MFGFKRLIDTIVTQRLDEELAVIRRQISDIENVLKDITPAYVDKNNPMPVLDFGAIDPFSIERDDKGQTRIGYFNGNKKAHEWWFITTIEQHNNLVEQFQQHIDKY